MGNVICDYCGQPAVLVTGQTIYPHRRDLWSKHFYLCDPCEAYVGCHPGTKNPLGRLADTALRRAKSAAHAAFDPLWQNGAGKRSKRYGWLAQQLGIPGDQCHIGMFDEAMCNRVVTICNARRAELKQIKDSPDGR